MREMSLFCPDFTSEKGRGRMVSDPHFVYGHYQIGCDTISDGLTRMRNMQCGFATIGGVSSGGLFYYAVALCSPNDNFSKRTGRYLVRQHMCDSATSQKRGVINVSNMISEKPAVVLKYVLEQHLNKARHLPSWTRQVVLFRGKSVSTNISDMKHVFNNRVKQNPITDEVCLSPTITIYKGPMLRPMLASTRRNLARREAALKAWETRRRNSKV